MKTSLAKVKRGDYLNEKFFSVSTLLNVLQNAGYGLRFRKPKVFLIGFNKCGTTSLHKFFRDQGLKSAHCWLGKRHLALEAVAHTDVLNVRRAFSDWQVFSDFTFLKGKNFVEPLGSGFITKTRPPRLRRKRIGRLWGTCRIGSRPFANP